jgi:hypothetical protein
MTCGAGGGRLRKITPFQRLDFADFGKQETSIGNVTFPLEVGGFCCKLGA